MTDSSFDSPARSAFDLEGADRLYLLGVAACLEASTAGVGAEEDGAFHRSRKALVEQKGEIIWPEVSELRHWPFIRGVVDSIGEVSEPSSGDLFVRLRSVPQALHERLLVAIGAAPVVARDGAWVWEGVAALDLLGHIYASPHDEGEERDTRGCRWAVPAQLRGRRHIASYRGWCRSLGIFSNRKVNADEIAVQKLCKEAVVPSKERISDSGYDLTLIYEEKRFGNVVLYGTGVKVAPPFGWYFDIVPRSSIIKRGYILANSVGIIDRSYRGELYVPLIKLDEQAPELEMPARVAQLIPRPIAHFPIRVTDELTQTHRGTGGFGSSGQ